MLQVRENEISLRNWSRGAAHLRTSEGNIAGTAVSPLAATRLLTTHSTFP